MSRRSALVGLALVVAAAVAVGVLVLPGRDSRPPVATQPRAAPGQAFPCPAEHETPAACAEAVARTRAASDHPVAVQSMTCAHAPVGRETFDCDVDLVTTCDAYRVRYEDGYAFVTQPVQSWCIHLSVVEDD